MNVYHIQQNETLWRVNTEGPDRGLSSFNQKHEAVNHAKALAQANRPSKIIVHARNGDVETEFTYAAEQTAVLKS
ncbi:MAG TPA: DUF2188 domain-containing protein [Planctomycetota bacterium]|nr:DUF2188 domain-containing protein [Planctomycetota bacterium]